MEEGENILEKLIELKTTTKKSIIEHFYTILKILVILIVIGWFGFNLYGKYQDGKINDYTIEINENKKKLDSIKTKIIESEKIQKSIDESIKKSKIKSKYYEKEVNKLIKDFKNIRTEVQNSPVNDAYDVVRKHLDSLRTKNITTQ